MTTSFILFAICFLMFLLGAYGGIWWPFGIAIAFLVVSIAVRIAALGRQDDGGTPTDRYHPDAGTGVQYQTLNSQPDPRYAYQAPTGTVVSNGWKNNKDGTWSNGRDWIGWFENGTFIKGRNGKR